MKNDVFFVYLNVFSKSFEKNNNCKDLVVKVINVLYRGDVSWSFVP